MKYEFTKLTKEKGWTLKEVAAFWGYSVRGMAKIAKDPKTKDWLALKALPDRSKDK